MKQLKWQSNIQVSIRLWFSILPILLNQNLFIISIAKRFPKKGINVNVSPNGVKRIKYRSKTTRRDGNSTMRVSLNIPHEKLASMMKKKEIVIERGRLKKKFRRRSWEIKDKSILSTSQATVYQMERKIKEMKELQKKIKGNRNVFLVSKSKSVGRPMRAKRRLMSDQKERILNMNSGVPSDHNLPKYKNPRYKSVSNR